MLQILTSWNDTSKKQKCLGARPPEIDRECDLKHVVFEILTLLYDTSKKKNDKKNASQQSNRNLMVDGSFGMEYVVLIF